jgi:hypothetical protein
MAIWLPSSYQTSDGSLIDFNLSGLSQPRAMNLFPFSHSMDKGETLNRKNSDSPHWSTTSLIVCHWESLIEFSVDFTIMHLKYLADKHLVINRWAMKCDLPESLPPHKKLISAGSLSK